MQRHAPALGHALCAHLLSLLLAFACVCQLGSNDGSHFSSASHLMRLSIFAAECEGKRTQMSDQLREAADTARRINEKMEVLRPAYQQERNGEKGRRERRGSLELLSFSRSVC